MAFLGKTIWSLGGALRSTRSFHVTAQASSLKKWAFNAAGYNKYGLLTDDILNDMDPDVIEAVRRLPDKLVDERNYRMIRANQLAIQKTILPKSEWTKLEDDVPYLRPYLAEVEAERKEREAWDAAH